MHPALVLIPALGLVLVPRLWVSSVLKRHDDEQESGDSARAVARELLDRHGLHDVGVEATDTADHYDPKARVVRLSRRNFERNSLSAVTTAAHEVAHALQHAQHYRPFALRVRLAQLADLTGKAGTVLLVAYPATYLITRQPLPRAIIGRTALGMVGTSAVAQLAALPTELDASFKRAMPMLRDGFLDPDQVADARRILVACSFTYVAASFASVLHVWPWLGRTPVALKRELAGGRQERAKPRKQSAVERDPRRNKVRHGRRPQATRPGWETVLRTLGKPLVRRWLRTVAHAQH